ncbi:MAG: type IX secretion system membrane protein PorP/SprF, partial [Bacteroidota bacterium]
MRIRLATIFCVLIAGGLFAQQDPQFTHYMFYQLYFNPAGAGAEGVTKLTALHRSHWLGYQPTFDDGGAPTT